MTETRQTNQKTDTEVLTGRIKRIRFEAEDSHFTVLSLQPEDESRTVTVVGDMVEPIVGQLLEVHGHWTNHPKYGQQFQATRVDTKRPQTADGIQEYLTEFVKGIGPALSERIVDEFGPDTFHIIEESPDKLTTVEGIGPKKLQVLHESWTDAQRTRAIMKELVKHGLSRAYAVRIYDEYGKEALEILREDPYQLATDVRGIGFKQADRIAATIGIPDDDPNRWNAVVRYVLKQAESEGHCFLPKTELVERILEETGGDPRQAEEALQRLQNKEQLILEFENQDPERIRVYRKPVYQREQYVARRLQTLHETQPGWAETEVSLDEHEGNRAFEYNDQQREAIQRVVRGDVMVLTGGPGTGKTTTTNGMIELLKEQDRSFELAAPTGRAAKRLSEQTGEPAQTLHRLLEYDPNANTFRKNRQKPLQADVILVDEMSMVDLWLMSNLVEATQPTSGLILIGDADQLPSVGGGTVFNDCIESGRLSVVKLTTIYRQGPNSGVVMNAHKINKGEPPEDGYNDFFYRNLEDQKAEDFLVDVATRRMPKKTGLDPIEDIQIIAPMYERACGVNAFNERLQERLTDSSDETPTDYRIGDKVMQTENNYEKNVFNGNAGYVVDYNNEDDELVVEYPETQITTSYDQTERRHELTLAYAITVHKSQGSEYPAVLIPVAKAHTYMLNRPLLYTAVTRAEKYVLIAGPWKTLNIAVSKEEQQTRHTQLEKRLGPNGV